MDIRSFLAFELPQPMRRAVSEVHTSARREEGRLKWVKVDNIHLTVVFMGQVSVAALASVQSAASRVCAEWGPFSAALSGMGVFGGRSSPRVLWLGVQGETDRMARFRDRLQKALEPLGVRQEKRPFNPHLTLARFPKGSYDRRKLEALLQRHGELTSPPCLLETLTLFRSDLKPGGAVYTRLDRWRLTGER